MFTHLRSTLDNPGLFVIFSVGKRTQPNSLFSSTERFLWSRYPPYDVSNTWRMGNSPVYSYALITRRRRGNHLFRSVPQRYRHARLLVDMRALRGGGPCLERASLSRPSPCWLGDYVWTEPERPRSHWENQCNVALSRTWWKFMCSTPHFKRTLVSIMTAIVHMHILIIRISVFYSDVSVPWNCIIYEASCHFGKVWCPQYLVVAYPYRSIIPYQIQYSRPCRSSFWWSLIL